MSNCQLNILAFVEYEDLYNSISSSETYSIFGNISYIMKNSTRYIISVLIAIFVAKLQGRYLLVKFKQNEEAGKHFLSILCSSAWY